MSRFTQKGLRTALSLGMLIRYRLLLVVSALCGTVVSAQPFAIPVPAQAIGVIEVDGEKGRQAFGTAFVAGNPRRVYSCAHVVQNLSIIRFRPLGGTAMVLSPQYLSKPFDVARLQAAAATGGSFRIGSFDALQVNDLIYYLGWDTRSGKFMQYNSRILAKGQVYNQGSTVDFIEFEGNGIPGYSGGPVLNSGGEVVAVFRESWQRTGKKGSKAVRINRAFSITPALE